MSFRTQRLTNRFPIWTKIRKDSSSFGSRFLSVFAEGLEQNSITNNRLIQDFFLHKRNLGRSFLHEIQLEGEDILVAQETSNGYEWIYPVIEGTIGPSTYTLERSVDIADLLMSYPTRLNLVGNITLDYLTVWDSDAPETIREIITPHRLWIKVANSSFFKRRKGLLNPNFGSRIGILLTGKDEFDIEIKESIEIEKETTYITKYCYKELTDVSYEGFDGDVSISVGPLSTVTEEDPFRVIVFDDMESILKVELESGVNSYFTFKGERYKKAEQYKKVGINEIDNEEILCSLLLKDTEEVDLEIVSFAINPDNTFVYGLDNFGYIHVFELELPEFLPYSTNEDETNYVDIEPLSSYPKYESTEPCWIRFSRLRSPVSYITIKRTDPLDNVLYLQQDKTTWSPSEARLTFSNSSDPQNVRFETEYDLVGEWEYIVTVQTQVDRKTSVVKVNVGTLIAKVSIDSEISGAEVIYFEESKLILRDSSNELHMFTECLDKYLMDENNSIVWTSDEYDEVEVNP